MADVERLRASGKIRGFYHDSRKVLPVPAPYQDEAVHPAASNKSGRKKVDDPSYLPGEGVKSWIKNQLTTWSKWKSITVLHEQVFHQGRKWRFDHCIGLHKIAIEYEGIFQGLAHRSIAGTKRDIDKYNAATLQGWTIIRLAAHNYKQLFRFLDEAITLKTSVCSP